MRVLILGGSGMLGHKMFQVLSSQFETLATFRADSSAWVRHPAFANADRSALLSHVNALDWGSVESAIKRALPAAVINCIGVVKQRDAINNAISSIQINSLFPHQLAQLCSEGKIRLIHFSTDCVFSGDAGGYSESSVPDPTDFYGRTKLLGELDYTDCLTLRTSIIGWELENHSSLLGWFATQRGREIKGYKQAVYSGLTTTHMARLVGDILAKWPRLEGIYHVASVPITKYDLLVRLRDALHWNDVIIERDDQVRCDRSMSATRFMSETGWTAPDWPAMIAALADEWPIYKEWRSA